MSDNNTNIDLNCFEQAGIGVCMQTPDKEISWGNQTLADWLGINKQSLSDPGIKDSLFQDSLPLLVVSPTGNERWLQRQTLSCDDGRTLCLFQDITLEQSLNKDNVRLEQQVKELKLTDNLTGLANRRSITQALEHQITRSRRYQNPLSAVMVYLDTNSNLRDESSDQITLAVSHFLRDRLRWVDQIGRWDDNVFLMILPETSLEDTQSLIEKILNEKSAIRIPVDINDPAMELSFGVACWQKGMDMRTLLNAVLENLKAQRDNA